MQHTELETSFFRQCPYQLLSLTISSISDLKYINTYIYNIILELGLRRGTVIILTVQESSLSNISVISVGLKSRHYLDFQFTVG